MEEIVFENLRMTVWDVGGQEKLRALWRHYYGEEQYYFIPYTGQNLSRLWDTESGLIVFFQRIMMP